MELLNCPFCGGVAKVFMGKRGTMQGERYGFYIECDQCVCSFGKCVGENSDYNMGDFGTKQEVVECWNSRIQ